MTFSDVIGQEAAKLRLRELVDADRVPNALMLCGRQGVGKMALALSMATYLLGEKEATEHPDSEHAQRQMAMLRKLEHPDLIFTYPTIKPASWPSDKVPVSDDFIKQWHEMIGKGAYFTITEWMDYMKATTQQAIITAKESDELFRKLSLKASQGGYKVCIIWLAERMNETAANKLLKILEEPPAKTLFLLLVEEPDKLLETIRSRTQRIDIPRIETSQIATALQQLRGLDADTARRVARVADGSWIKAVEEISAESERQEFLELFITLMRAAFTRNLPKLKTWSDDIAKMGREQQRRLLAYFQRMIRESFIYNFQEPELSYMTEAEENFVGRFAPYINETNVIAFNEMLQRSHRDIGQNALSKIVFFDLALNTIILLLKNKTA